jgi:hypothetical protein
VTKGGQSRADFIVFIDHSVCYLRSGGRGRTTIPTRRPPPQTATVVAGVCNFGSDCPDRQQHWAPASTWARHISCCTRRFQEFRAGSVFQITVCSGRFGEKSGWRFLKIQNDRSALLSVAARNFKSLAYTSSATSPLLIFHAPQMYFQNRFNGSRPLHRRGRIGGDYCAHSPWYPDLSSPPIKKQGFLQ